MIRNFTRAALISQKLAVEAAPLQVLLTGSRNSTSSPVSSSSSTAQPVPATDVEALKRELFEVQAKLAKAVGSGSPAGISDLGENIPFKGDAFKHAPTGIMGGLREFSVVYTDRAVNHMSADFVQCMNDLNAMLKEAYNAKTAVIMPGSGTFGMEACARQFCGGKKAMVMRNGYFSYRWTDIFEQTGIPSDAKILNAQPLPCDDGKPQFQPLAIEDVKKILVEEKPGCVFAPHVETSTGIMFPDWYIKELAAAAHEVGAAFVLDGVASGTVWVDMEELGIDAFITAPQKGWTGPACAGIVMLSNSGYDRVRASKSDSMVLNLNKWIDVMEAYDKGGFMYYTTMPTDSLLVFRNVARETQEHGFPEAKKDILEMGNAVRQMMYSKGLKSVAPPGWEAPGVVVVYTDDASIGAKFKNIGVQIAVGVPFMLGEPEGNGTFRIGLFGLDKIQNKELTLARLEEALDKVLA